MENEEQQKQSPQNHLNPLNEYCTNAPKEDKLSQIECLIKSLFSDKILVYNCYSQTKFCELVLPDLTDIKIQQQLVQSFRDFGIDAAYISGENQNKIRFPYNDKAAILIHLPSLKQKLKVIHTDDSTRIFAQFLVNRAQITFFKNTKRYELLVPPIYKGLENDMQAVLRENQIFCQKVENYRTKMHLLHFFQTTQVLQFIETLSNPRLIEQATDPLLILKNQKEY